MLFIDASIIVAILQREDDAQELYDRLIADAGPYRVSPMVRMEASLAIAREMAAIRKPNTPATTEMVEQARKAVDVFIDAIGAQDVPITSTIGGKALDAAARFGRIIGHPAKLNLGDCFAYACAQGYRARLAFKGDDFPHTDIGWDRTGSSMPSRRGS